MKIVKKIIGFFSLVFKFLFALIDPILRYIEMVLNIVFGYIFGWIVDLFALLPNIGFLSLGEGILGIAAGVLSFVFYDNIFFWIPISFLPLKILFCILVAIIAYFILYFIIKFLLNFISSIISFIIVLIRLSIYLPASNIASFVKISIQITTSVILYILFYEYWKDNVINFILLVIGMCVFVSLIFLFIRNDVKVNNLGVLGEVKLEDLKAFNHSIGIYIMTLGVLPVYIGRAIEFNNGGLRKRLRDYIRKGNSSRKHTSGKLINSYKDELNLYVIELGHTEEDVAFVKYVESSMIENIFTRFNVVDSTVNYLINILGYIIGCFISCFLVYSFLENNILSCVLYLYLIISAIICVIMYLIQNSKK